MIPVTKIQLFYEIQDMLNQMDIVLMESDNDNFFSDLVDLNRPLPEYPPLIPLRRMKAVFLSEEKTIMYYLLTKEDHDFTSPSCDDILKYSESHKNKDLIQNPSTADDILYNLSIMFCKRGWLLTPEQGIDFRRFLKMLLNL